MLQPGDTAIDVGAHIGFFTMLLAAAVGRTGHVYAFEPFEANADLLERSVAENHFDDRVTFQRAAAGAETGSATLTFPVETLNSGGAYLLRGGDHPLAGNQKTNVPVITLDSLTIDGVDLRVTRLKDGRIDIDGITATSAGAMNAVVYAYGHMQGGKEGAREQLETFWRKVSDRAAWTNPMRRTPLRCGASHSSCK